jgi:hypothetical protein
MTTVQSALMSAFMLGRSGHGNIDFLEDLANKVKEGDSAVWQEIASLKRDVASLRKEVEASRPHKVIALKRAD